MRRIATMVFASILCVSSVSSVAFADDGALKPGAPAGVNKAQLGGPGFVLLAAGGILAAASLALLINSTTSKGPAILSGGTGGGTTTTTTTTTSTSTTG